MDIDIHFTFQFLFHFLHEEVWKLDVNMRKKMLLFTESFFGSLDSVRIDNKLFLIFRIHFY